MNTEEQDLKLQLWLQKKHLKKMENMRGNGTSLISLIIPPKGQIGKITQMLQKEYGTASNIKDRVNRLSVLSAITSTKEKLKLYKNTVPENGLAIYCGNVIHDNGKEKKVNIDIEPSKPIKQSLYRCDNKFHVKSLLDVLQVEDKYGFVVMDGNGCLFGTLRGSHKEVLYKFSVDLPKKHGRGGQSAQRFGRLRMEKRQAYVKKITELLVKLFIKNEKVWVKGFIFAGSAEFKHKLIGADTMDQRIKKKILKVVDISYGAERGFNQAIGLSAGCLGDVRFVEEKQLISSFFEHISKNSGMIIFGVKETMNALEAGAVETLVIWDEIDLFRVTLKEMSLDESPNEKIIYLNSSELEGKTEYNNKTNDKTWEIVEKEGLIDWLIANYSNYGMVLEIISDKTSEGTQFCNGFGGVGGFLRYQVNIEDYQEIGDNFYNDENSEDDEFEDEFNEYDDFM